MSLIFANFSTKTVLRLALKVTSKRYVILHFIKAAFCLLDDQPRQHIKKQRHYFVNKDHLVKAIVYPVVAYGCGSWTIRKLNTEELMLLNCGVGEDS